MAAGSWTVFYHAGFTGRAQPLELMLQEAGATWARGLRKDVTDVAFFAAPIVQDPLGVVLSQTTLLAEWVGERTGYSIGPTDSPKYWMLRKFAHDVADVWAEAYEMRTRENKRDKLVEFVTGRLAKWFATLSEIVARLTDGKEYLSGDSPCWVDFLLANALEVIDFCYGSLAESLKATFPGVWAIHTRVHARPLIAAYLRQDATPVLYPSVQSSAIVDAE